MNGHVSLSTRTEHIGTIYFVALLRQELGRRIAVARKAAGLSQQQLAEKIGLRHAQDISRYERGKVEVPAARIDLIAEATGRPRSYFTRDPSEVDDPPQSAEQLRQMVREEVSAALVPLEQILARLADPSRQGSRTAGRAGR